MDKQEDTCEPEWLDAEDPLFMLYTRCDCQSHLCYAVETIPRTSKHSSIKKAIPRTSKHSSIKKAIDVLSATKI